MTARPLRVVQVTSTLLLGGAETIVVTLAEELRRMGVEVSVVRLRDYGGEPLVRRLTESGIETFELGARHLYSIGGWLGLRRYLRRVRPDLVHTHLTYADVLGRSAAWPIGLPVVSTLHNEPASFALHRYDQRWFERLTARHMADALVAVSPGDGETFARQWGLPPGRVHEIPNGIDLSRWIEVPPVGAAPVGPPTVLTVGRLTAQKAQDVLLRAAAIVLKSLPTVRFQLAGRGDREAELRALAVQLGIADAVEFLGEREDVPRLMAGCDAFVLSSAREGLPLVILEAMAAGRPVIATDVGGNRGALGEPPVGVLVRPGDAERLACELLRVLTDRGEARRLGEAARTRAMQTFSVRAMAERYLDLYTKVLGDRGKLLPRNEARSGPPRRKGR